MVRLPVDATQHDLAAGWPREVLGYVMVSVSIICLLSTDRLLLILTAPIADNSLLVSGSTPPLVRGFNWVFRPPWPEARPLRDAAPGLLRSPRWRGVLAGGAVLLFAVQAYAYSAGVLRTVLAPGPSPLGQALVSWYGEECLPPACGDWRRGTYSTKQRSGGSIWGERSCKWEFSREGQAAQISLDYPFDGWHELTQCYVGAGWRVIEREVLRPKGEEAWEAVRATMVDGTGRQGVLYFSFFADDDSAVSPPGSDLSDNLARRLKRNWGSLRTVQVQAFSGIMFQPTNEDLAQLLRLHLETRRELRAAMLGPARGAGS